MAYSLHKSLQSTTTSSGVYISDSKSKSGFLGTAKRGGTGGGAYYAPGAATNVSLDDLTSTGKVASLARPATMYEDFKPASGPSFNRNTFYSPTANAIGMTAGNASAADAHLSSLGQSGRSSTYLPAGFYSGANISSNVNLSNRASTMPIQRSDSPHNYSRSTASNLNVTPQPGQRAPSAYLDNLLGADRI